MKMDDKLTLQSDYFLIKAFIIKARINFERLVIFGHSGRTKFYIADLFSSRILVSTPDIA